MRARLYGIVWLSEHRPRYTAPGLIVELYSNPGSGRTGFGLLAPKVAGQSDLADGCEDHYSQNRRGADV
jgi:hypothetical protein